MINLFVTYRCNLACPYCFARDLAADHPGDLGPERFAALLAWMSAARLSAVGFLGGEPTLHPRLAEMTAATRAAGIGVALFTNGLFPAALAAPLAASVSTFVVNYNPPAFYAPAQARRLEANLAALRRLGARLVFSRNFSRASLDCTDLLAAIDRHGVRSVRYDISRPSASGANDHFALDATGAVLSHVVGFVKACEARGVRTGLDCSLRLCDVRDEDRRYLERVSVKFTGVCHPSIDVHPDLSASYCLPLRHVAVPDVTAFPDQEALLRHFAQMVRPLRQANVSTPCLDCKDFMRRCQGGCLALSSAQTAAREAAGAPEP